MAFRSVITRNKTGLYSSNASEQHLLLDIDLIVGFTLVRKRLIGPAKKLRESCIR